MGTADLGCGHNKRRGAFGVDANIDSQANLIWDLNTFPYPLKTNSYDMVFSKFCIEHLDNPLEFLKECKRIAKKKVIIITDNATSLHYIFGHRFKSCGMDHHLYSWNDIQIRRLFVRAGMGNIKITRINFPRNKWKRFIAYYIAKVFPTLKCALKVEAKVNG